MASSGGGGSIGRSSSRRLDDPTDDGRRKPHHIKLVLVGESNVGKSSIADRYVNNNFRESPEGTIGAAYLRKELHLPDDFTVKFEIWDTAGQERFRSLAPMYYRGAQAAIIVFDVTNAESFLKAKEWVKELERHVLSEVITALAGNKADMVAHRQVAFKEAQAYAQANGLIYYETSARKGTNIADMFLAIAREYEGRVIAKGAMGEPEVRRNRYAILEGSVESVEDPPPPEKKCCST